MAKYYTIAKDGIVRGHLRANAALKKIRRGGRVQIEGKPEWHGPEFLERLIEDRKRAAVAEAAAHLERHRAGHHESKNGTLVIWGCSLCRERHEERTAAFRAQRDAAAKAGS